MDKIAVLIPCYNENITIKKVILDWKRELPEATVYVYDNNSTDGSDKIAKQAGAIVRYEHQQGKGNVVKRMFREIDEECYLMLDGDDTYPAEMGHTMVDSILTEHADIFLMVQSTKMYLNRPKLLGKKEHFHHQSLLILSLYWIIIQMHGCF